jgi:putative transposase
MRIVGFCLMPNHWHLILWPKHDGDLSRFLHWVTGTHGRRWRRSTGTEGEGAVYQSRFKAVGVSDLHHLLTVWCYVERNPLRAGLVSKAEEWPWSSAAHFSKPSTGLVLDAGPVSRPQDWLAILNQVEPDAPGRCDPTWVVQRQGSDPGTVGIRNGCDS